MILIQIVETGKNNKHYETTNVIIMLMIHYNFFISMNFVIIYEWKGSKKSCPSYDIFILFDIFGFIIRISRNDIY